MDRKRPVPSQEKNNGGKKRKTDKDRTPLNDPRKSNQPSTSETSSLQKQCTWFNSPMAILDYTLVNDIVFLCVSLFVCLSTTLQLSTFVSCLRNNMKIAELLVNDKHPIKFKLL